MKGLPVNHRLVIVEACLSMLLIHSTVNVIKGKLKWDAASQFDASKDKSKFRQFEAACDRVKCVWRYSPILTFLQANSLAAIGISTKSNMVNHLHVYHPRPPNVLFFGRKTDRRV